MAKEEQVVTLTTTDLSRLISMIDTAMGRVDWRSQQEVINYDKNKEALMEKIYEHRKHNQSS